MLHIYNNSFEEITLNIPTDMKRELLAIKDELNISLSAIYEEALSNYIQQKELERWKKGIEIALNDSEYLSFVDELSKDVGDIYEY